MFEYSKNSSEIVKKNNWRKVIKSLQALTLISPMVVAERAEAVEIPQEASYEQGMALLREAAEAETFETYAIYVSTNRDSFWYSDEGNNTGKKVSAPDVYLDRVKRSEIHQLITEISNAETETIEVKEIHTHPIIGDGSNAPSGKGYAGVNGDTGVARIAYQDIGWNEPLNEIGIWVNIERKMINHQGVWSYELNPEAAQSHENANIRSGIAEIAGYWKDFVASQSNGLSFTKELNIKPYVEDIKIQIEYLHSLQDSWPSNTRTLTGQEVIDSEAYKDLLKAFAGLGVVVKLTPFSEETGDQ